VWTWVWLSGLQPVAHGEQRRIHPRAGVSGRGVGPGEVSWATRPRWAGAGPVSGLTRKKKRSEEENRKWAGWRMSDRDRFKEWSWDGPIFTAVGFATKIICCKQRVSSFIPDKGVVATK
jgi:hypothetical protein